MNNYKIEQTFSKKIIYVYSSPGELHLGRLKIGETTIRNDNPTYSEMKIAAESRIKSYTLTSDTPFEIEHVELAISNQGKIFKDVDVHEILKRSGFERKGVNIANGRSEWFEINLETAKSAIKAAKEGRSSLNSNEIGNSSYKNFTFRPNQLDAIKKTSEALKKGKSKFLWNAKMRFGKTTAAMQVAKVCKLKKVIIITHRPSVRDDWYEDFNKIFCESDNKYVYSSKTKGFKLEEVLKKDVPFVYFASIQDLRGSEIVVSDKSSGSNNKGKDKNNEVFYLNWDMLVVDEAHEGTQSKLGDVTLDKINSKFTLFLSGTPFNILHKHEENEIYTWDYVMEQEEKFEWDKRNPGLPNPYSELPELNIFTYDIDTFSGQIGLSKGFTDELDGAFKFHEFFRVHKDENGNDTDEFIYKDKVVKFLDLLVDDKLKTKFPYATEEYKSYNKHSLWHLPNRVKVIEAMEKLLKAHRIFGDGFGIVNISGDSKDDENDRDAKEKVINAINKYEYTITLTGQRLTTGASIPEWTAVFMLSDVTSATTYLQTAFRCQTPAYIGGKIKTKGYIFDFAPDRTLKLIAEVIELNHKSSKTNTPEQEAAMQKFLNFCPIISSKNGVMKEYDVSAMLGQLKRAIIQRVSQNGFDDPKLYNDNLLKLSELEIKEFNDLRAIVGNSTRETINEIVINNLGMNELQIQKGEEIEKKKKELTEEEKELLKKLKEAREQKRTAISILRAVSIRMPLLVFGADVGLKEEITLDKFIELVDEASWVEFMPTGLTKEKFREFTKFYDEDVFKGVTLSIRAKAKDCDDLLPTDRIIAIAGLFSTFKNPDKETVLTPWKVVNKHLTLAFGGHCFNEGFIFDGKPEWISKDVDTSIWSDENTKILEINSKSGLYPLLAAYNIYSRKLRKLKKPEEDVYLSTWKQILEQNIFILCKSPMAQSITKRTLTGYNKNIKLNIVYIENLVDKLQRKNDFRDYNFKDEIWTKFNIEDKFMKFKAVIGNPPYQINSSTNFSEPIYHLFIDASIELKPEYVSLIHPARFLFRAGATPKEWNEKILNSPNFSVLLYEPVSQNIFKDVDIKGGVCITLWDENSKSGGLKGSFTQHKEINDILFKVKDDLTFMSLVSPAGGSPTLPYTDKYGRIRRYFRSSAFFDQSKFFSNEINEKNTIKIYGLEKGNKRTFRYVSKDVLSDSNIDKWKVYLPSANGNGAMGEKLSSPFIGEPNSGSTESFIQIGPFLTKKEAESCLKYIKTKFCRILLGTLKVTQGNPKKVWGNIPLQDFSTNERINWDLNIEEIDKQLFTNYNLSKSEIDFINKTAKDMQ